LRTRVSAVTVGGVAVDSADLAPLAGLVGVLLGKATTDALRDADSPDLLETSIKRKEREKAGAGFKWAADQIRHWQLRAGLGLGNG
ncbi:unnamed protein product, partial [marine sediment metagenome]